MRGYYGRPPIAMLKTRAVALRPFMDTDVMWGINGLGEQADINAILSRLKKDLKNATLKQAAAGVAISISLNTIPVIGTIAAVVFSVVQAIGGSHYQKEIKEVMADAEIRSKQIVASYELKMEAAQNAVFDQEMAAGTSIAMACQGMHGLGDIWSKIGHAVTNTTSSVTKEVKRVSSRVGAEVKREVQTVTGAEGLGDAQKARDKLLVDVKKQMEAQYQQAVANLTSPEFRAELRKTIVSKVVSDPQIEQVVRTRCGIAAGQPLPGASMSMPALAKGGAFAAVGVTAALVAFAVLGGGHH